MLLLFLTFSYLIRKGKSPGFKREEQDLKVRAYTSIISLLDNFNTCKDIVLLKRNIGVSLPSIPSLSRGRIIL